MHLTKFHQYTRPRHTNPTYNSNSVGTSLGTFYTQGLHANQKSFNYNRGKQDNFYDNPYGQHSNNNPERPMAQSQKYESQQKLQYSQRYEQSKMSQKSPEKLQRAYSSQKQSPLLSNNPYANRETRDSRFSKLGTQSLLLPQMNERDIFQKQAKGYNIISIKPNQYQETIKKYPKLHLENDDANFYRKVQIENEYKSRYAELKRQQQARKWNEIDRLQKQQESYNSRQGSGYSERQPMAGRKTDFMPKDLHVQQRSQE